MKSKINQLRKFGTKHKNLVKKYNQKVDLYWKAVEHGWTGKAKKYNHELYYMRKRMLKDAIKHYKEIGDESAVFAYEKAYARHVSWEGGYGIFKKKHPKGQFHLRKIESENVVRSKYEIISIHYDEIEQIWKDNKGDKPFDAYSQETWDLLTLDSIGKVVQSDRNGVWLWKVSEDEYEVISPL